MERLLQDLRIAVRGLLRRRTFTSVAVLTLATGIGATTAIFSLVDAVLLRPLPYEQPSRLFRLWQAFPSWRSSEVQRSRWDHVGISYPQYAAIRDTTSIVDNVAILQMLPMTITGTPGAERVNLAYTTATLLPTLGLRALVGRGLSAEDEAGPGQNVAVIGYELWRRRFLANPAVVGQTITVSQKPYLVVGVMPPEMRPLSTVLTGASALFTTPDIWIPIGRGSTRATGSFGHGYQAIVRLKPGVEVKQAEGVLVPLLGHVYATYPHPGKEVPGGSLEPLGRYETLASRAGLWMLLAAAAIVLLVACGNVANLMVSETAPRSRELAIRGSLGASRGRLVRMLLTESLVITCASALLGLAFAWWSVDALVAITPPGTPNIDAVRIDYRVFLFSLALTMSTAIAVGLVPAWLASRKDILSGLREMQPTLGRVGGRLQRFVCASQVALAAAVLATAVLLVQSLVRLAAVDPGFDSSRLLAFNIELPRTRYTDVPQRGAAYERLRAGLQAVPGIRDVAVTSTLPFRGTLISSNPITVVDGRSDARTIEVERRYVSPNFFKLLGIRLVEGEWLAENTPTTDCRMLVSEATVRRLWPDGGAVGAQVAAGRSTCRIAGVVTDTRERSLAADPLPTFYMIAPGDSSNPVVVVKSDLAPDALVRAVRRAVAAVDPEIPVFDPAMMDVIIVRTLATERYRAIPLALFAFASMVLAGIGIYGVLSQIVAGQTRALGIRLALGASPARLKAMVLRQAVLIGAVGLVAGVIAGRAAAQVLRAFLFGVRLTDPLTYVAVVVAVALVTLVAGWIPARRVTRLDPASVLRTE